MVMVSSRGAKPAVGMGDPVGCGPVCAEAEHNGRGETAQPRRPPHWQGEAGMLLLRAGTECENDRDNRAGAGLTIYDPHSPIELLL